EDFVEIYNSAVDRLKRHAASVSQDMLVDTEDTRIKWSRQVKASLEKLQYSEFSEAHLRHSLYRPFTKMWSYFDDFWNEERYKQPLIFPIPGAERENQAICVPLIGNRGRWSVIVTNLIPNYTLASLEGSQCFPYYVYDEDGGNRRENITDWALAQ